MPHQWPAKTVFREVKLEVEDLTCPKCQSPRSVGSSRVRCLFTCTGPVRLTCQLCYCSNPDCPDHQTYVGPEAETRIAMPYWVLGWDVVCWLGHRRFSRHWSVPQIRHELKDRFGITLSKDGVRKYLQRYQQMVSTRQHDPEEFRKAYQGAKGLVLSIDGLQPEKGHETLYVVRELGQNRVWFAQALLSNTQAELAKVFTRVQKMVAELGLPVQCWISDKQKALVNGIAKVFPGVPHRYCENHFLRDLAKPMLETDSNAKVQMRKKVRGLRSIEQAVEAEQAEQAASATSTSGAAPTAEIPGIAELPPTAEAEPAILAPPAGDLPADARTVGGEPTAPATVPTSVAAVGPLADVLDYCTAVRGILNDNRGGPCKPPGERMEKALNEVRQSIQQHPETQNGGSTAKHLKELTKCIDSGLESVADARREVQEQLADISQVAATLDPKTGCRSRRRQRFVRLKEKWSHSKVVSQKRLSKQMTAWLPGLFVCVALGRNVPVDNLDLERFFRLPKGHERRIHGRKHIGMRVVREGATLVPTLDAHQEHPDPFTVQQLLPYCKSSVPVDQQDAQRRHKIMRQAASTELRPELLRKLNHTSQNKEKKPNPKPNS